jgi:hypothetical protein
MEQPRFLSKFLIYKGTDNFVYDEDKPEYNCFIPLSSGRYFGADFWICNEQGEVHPGYNVAGVLVTCSLIGEPIAENPMLTENFND